MSAIKFGETFEVYDTDSPVEEVWQLNFYTGKSGYIKVLIKGKSRLYMAMCVVRTCSPTPLSKEGNKICLN